MFCGNCGFALSQSGAFCPQCGARGSATASPMPPQQQPPAQGPPLPGAGFGPQRPSGPPPSSSNSGLKILGIVLACVFALGLVVVGGIVYAVHRVKTAVVDTAKTYGVELPTTTSTRRSSSSSNKRYKPCEMLSKEEASSMLGEPIERAEFQELACMYYGPPGLALKLAKEQADAAMKKAEAPGAPGMAGEVATAMDRLLNAGAKEMPMLIFAVDTDGEAQMTALTATKAIFSGIGRGADPKNEGGLGMGKDIPNLGQRAVFMPKLGLNVLQDGKLIRLVPGPVPDGDAKTIELARVLLKRL